MSLFKFSGRPVEYGNTREKKGTEKEKSDHGVKSKPNKQVQAHQEESRIFRSNHLGEGYKLVQAGVSLIRNRKKSPACSVGDMRKLMGLLNCYRRYIPNFTSQKKKNQSTILSSQKIELQ